MNGHIRHTSWVAGVLNEPKAVLIAASSIFALLTSLSVMAEDSTSPGAQSTSGALTEIVVTAQKRSENVQEVPASVTALSAEALENRQIKDITDLQRQIPSMNVGQLYGANLITLRGISTGLTSGTEDPSVAVHVNGVYQPRSRSLDVALMDLDRVEVLSGPQGTLYGRNATGGVVNYITKGPTKEFTGEVTGLAANYDRYGLKGTVSGPITEELAVRVSGLWDDQRTGFTKNLLAGAPNETLEAKTSKGGHVAVTYQPVDSLKLDLDGMYLNTHTTTIFAALGPSNAPFVTAALGAQTFAPYEVYSSYPAKLNSDYGQVSFTAAWDVNKDVQLKSITVWQSYKDEMDIDNTAAVFTAVAVNQRDDDHTLTQEIDLTTHAFDRLTSIYGLFYFDDTVRINTDVPFAIAPPPNFYIYTNHQQAKSYAAFTDQTLNVTNRFRLIAGVRFNRDRKSISNGLSIQTVGDVCDTANSKTWQSWTPRVGAQYDVSEGIMTYAGWQKGFKSGGFTANTCGNEFDPETIQGPEIGIKSELFDRRLRLNVAGYYYNYKKLQVEQVVGIGQFSVKNAAEAVLEGVEVAAQGRITDRLSADLTMNVQSAKYTSFKNCNQTVSYFACSTPATLALTDVSGNWLNRAPPYSINAGVEYGFDVLGSDLLLRAESFWSGTVHFDEYGTPALTQSAYSVQNLFLTFTPAKGRYQIRGFAKNVGNQNFKISGFYNSADGEPTGSWAPPRTFGGEVTVRF